MHSHRGLISWFFALVLLFAQGATFAHALTHLHDHDAGQPDKVCEVCVAQAQLGSAAPPAPLVVPRIPLVHADAVAPATFCSDPARVVARARAPPVRSA